MNLEQNIRQIPIEDIIPNRFQPRLNFDEKGLEDLANSIKEHGIIQPLVLRHAGDKYEIIAGERRFKAATMAGLKTVPAVIANIDDNKSAEVAIVENVQRKDLSPIEEARSYKNLLDKGYLTQSELAKKMGLSQSAIANKLRLLNLDDSVQEALLNNEISERHARSLLVLDNPEDQKTWLDKIIKNRMTVRELDEALKGVTSGGAGTESDIPLVKAPDIDSIRQNATELPNLSDGSDIARKLREIENEKMFNPDFIPIEQSTNESKGNFFNFLENEKVNMNMEERTIDIPNLHFDMPKPKEEEPMMQVEPSISVQEPVEAATQSKEEIISPTPVNEQPTEPLNFTPKVDPSLMNEENFDPVDLIETLDPDYDAKVEEQLGIDLKTAINEIRSSKDNLEKKGFNITLEETDLNDTYQFVIKIKKNENK